MSVPNTKGCSAAGSLTAGAICAETNTGITHDLTMDEYIDFLEPQPARECVPVGHFEGKTWAERKWFTDFTVCAEKPEAGAPKVKLPQRAGAICQSAVDWNKIKTALEQACRQLGSKCSYETRKILQRLRAPTP